MQPVTPLQIKKLQVLYNKIGFDVEQKKKTVTSFSQGRTDTTKELYKHEAIVLIKEIEAELLKINIPILKKIKKVFALCYEANFIYGYGDDDKRMNLAKINKFLRERGSVKKELFNQDEAELTKTINQFKQMFSHNQQAAALKEIKQYLSTTKILTHAK
jgi:hypothetical protein